jgi:hypothetical protein
MLVPLGGDSILVDVVVSGVCAGWLNDDLGKAAYPQTGQLRDAADTAASGCGCGLAFSCSLNLCLLALELAPPTALRVRAIGTWIVGWRFMHRCG